MTFGNDSLTTVLHVLLIRGRGTTLNVKPVLSTRVEGVARLIDSADAALDVLFANGRLVDGTGREATLADVGVADSVIAYVGRGERPPALHVVDVDGFLVCPGFIDMHAHSEISLMVDPRHEPKVTQGVTTEVLGQDGLSYAPVRDESALMQMRQQLAGWHGDPPGLDWSWRTVAELLGRLDHSAVNVAYLVPHGTVRAGIVGMSNRPPSRDELAAMCEAVERGIAEGAFGLSTGLTYVPAMYADTDELVELCRVVAGSVGYFSPHHRNYGASTFEAYAECIEIAKRSGVALHLTHAMLNRPPNRGRAPELLEMIETARSAGVDVSLDSYPYTAGCTYLHALLPGWAQEGGQAATLGRLHNPRTRQQLKVDLEVNGSDGSHGCVVDWSTVILSGIDADSFAGLIGSSIEDAASARGVQPFDLFAEILLADQLRSTCLMFTGHEENVQAIMTDRFHMGGSDSILVGNRPHPRGWGTFPRYLAHYTRSLGLFSLEECVRKFTALPAGRLGLPNRGLVREGYAADIVCLDPSSVQDTATYDRPQTQANGIPHVMVNGRFVVFDGAVTGDLPGRALKSGNHG